MVRFGDSKTFTCSKALSTAGENKQQFYTFKPVTHIQSLERNVRRQLQNRNYDAVYRFKDIWGRKRKTTDDERARDFTLRALTNLSSLWVKAVRERNCWHKPSTMLLRGWGSLLFGVNFASIPENRGGK
jgi:hypothetical protein